jgi:MFS family permease
MAARPLSPAPQQSTRFLALYAFAVCGGSIAYVPFLTILLPLQAQAMVGAGALDLLARIAFAGALAASLGNIAAGWLSDRYGSRRGWAAAGLVMSCGLLLVVPQVTTPGVLVGMIVMWQLALNLLLAPLAAWAGDTVPDEQKGLLGGLLAAAPACGAVTGMLITVPGLADPGQRIWLVAGIVLLSVGPVLVAGRARPMPQLQTRAVAVTETANSAAIRARPARLMWLARLLVQIAEASLFAFLLLWLRSLDPQVTDHTAAQVFTGVLVLAAGGALIAGRWSDRTARPILPLALSTAIAALGLGVMALAGSMAMALIGYVLFGLSSSVFLALHSSQTLRVLPDPRHRGRDLGLFNLTNTMPSLVMPWLTLALVPSHGFAALFAVLAGLVAAAALILAVLGRSPGLHPE